MARRKILITIAPVARVPDPDQDVINPISPTDVAEQVIECEKLGAGQVHLHVRDEEGIQTKDVEAYSETLRLIRQKSNILLQASSGGNGDGWTLDDRCNALRDDLTQVCSLNMGSINLGEEFILENKENDIRYFAKKMKDCNVVPELEIFERGMIVTTLRLMEEKLLLLPLNLSFPIGYYTGMQATVSDLDMMVRNIPSNSNWGISHDAMSDFSTLAIAIGMGAAKIRLGFEDSIYFAKGEKAKTNMVLVKKVAEMIRAMGFETMPSEEARELYGAKTT